MKLTLALATAFTLASLAGAAQAGPGEDLANKEKCNKCHTDKDTKKGPAFKSVAAKYAGKADAVDKLAAGLKAGGKMGDEEDHKKVVASDADLKALVQYVLSHK